MPAFSALPNRVEISNRTLVRLASPQRRASCGGSSQVHTGLMFADGTMYRGGKGHPDAPPCTKGDHQILAPKPPTPGYSEPTAFLPSGLPITLGKRNAGSSPARQSPTPSVASPAHGTGKRKVLGAGGAMEGSPIRGDSPLRTVTRGGHKGGSVAPPDHYIPGVSVDRGQSEREAASRSSPHRGIRVMDGCPTFEPPPFQKRPYSPFTKRVATKPNDNDIFNITSGGSSSGGDATASPAVRRASPSRSTAPYSLNDSLTPTSSIVRRGGGASESITAGRSPAPLNPGRVGSSAAAAPSGGGGGMTPRRSMTPSRANPPGSSSYNILTGQPL